MSVVFVDTETTGLDPSRHEVFEIALLDEEGQVMEIWLPVNLAVADPTALRMTHYFQRHPWTMTMTDIGANCFYREEGKWKRGSFREALEQIAKATAEKHLVAAVPSFDAAFIEALLRRNGLAPAWHYHLVDVEALVAGKLGIKPPWDSEELAAAVGVTAPEGAERHTALADARWAKAMYEAVLS
jgi:DNA polymerase III epsilon subunit-like protein